MWTRQHKQTKYRPADRSGALRPLFLAYFGFHAYHGEFGIYSKYQLRGARCRTAGAARRR